MSVKKNNLLRSRFQKPPDKMMEQFVASIDFDRRLYKQDIRGSIAHVKMLAKQDIISQVDCKKIVTGLRSIQREIDNGKFEFHIELEDIHMNIEKRLFEKIGEVAGKLHTARSRNDQIVLDIRLYMKDVVTEIIRSAKDFQHSLIELAEKNENVIMPGYTHLQQAQPVLFAHHLLAYFEMVQRDIERFRECYKRVDVCPLGSGALAGVAYKIDREYVAKLLKFSSITYNSIDSVSDRDFILDFMYAASVTMMHLSRLSEEIILWSTSEFKYIEIDDVYATTSSIMPQKKNPDVVELIRAKCGRVYASLVGLLTIMKALPLSYNRDLQEDKELLFNVVDTLQSCLRIYTRLIKVLKINRQQMYNSALENYMVATDIADYLVKKGLTFRKAHEITASLVKYAIARKRNFNKLKLAEYKKYSTLFDSDIYDITLEKSVNARNNIGGTSSIQVHEALLRAKKLVKVG
jgi:argininosuccinate lyase